MFQNATLILVNIPQELLVFCQGWGASLGLRLPPPFILQELLMSFWSPSAQDERKQHAVCSALHALFCESDIRLDFAVTLDVDPNGTFTWWVDGQIPSRIQIDSLFEEHLQSVRMPPSLSRLSTNSFN